MTLKAASLEWAIDFVASHSDSDLFPKILEIEAIQAFQSAFVKEFANKPLSDFRPGPSRRFIVPKDELSYRQATQLYLQDSILLSAVVHQFGQGIEDRRLPADRVYSYRFAPTPQHGLYGSQQGWNDFWTTAQEDCAAASTVLYCDIADFYNQIYHHTVENQLIESTFPNQAVKWIMALLTSTTAGVSRGIPVGPHGAHLIAEATLIPVDNAMRSMGLQFMRYADDIIVFCTSRTAARQASSVIASILDSQQRLTLQRHKTRIHTSLEFLDLCNTMIENRPISEDEDELLKLIQKYSQGDPYMMVSYNDISKEDWEKIDEKTIRGIIGEYLNQENVDYIRLRWFYRRLSQIGHPGAVDVSLENLDRLGPCFANVCTYLASIQTLDSNHWVVIGTHLLKLLDSDEVKSNEFFRLQILSLFTRNSHINHFSDLTSRFQSSDPHARREILLAAKVNGGADWIRGHKEYFDGMDPWQKMAFMFCCSDLPVDESGFFIGRFKPSNPLEKVLAKWAKKK